jgi:hypothetical protein
VDKGKVKIGENLLCRSLPLHSALCG